MSAREGRCRLCGKRDVLEPVMIPEDTTTNKLAVLDACPRCRKARQLGKAGKTAS